MSGARLLVFFGRTLAAALATSGLLIATSCGSSSQTVTGPSASKCGVQAQTEATAFPPAGGSGMLRVGTNRECTWAARSEAAWLTLAGPTDGQGDASIRFTVAANEAPSPRSAGITINDQQVRISQEGKPCEFRLSKDRETIDSAGGEATIEVDASHELCEWSASADESWITIVSGRDGRGDGRVTIRVNAAPGTSRTGTLNIGGQSVRIEQRPSVPGPAPTPPPNPTPTPPPSPGCSYTVTPASLSFGAPAGSGEVRVQAAAGCAWGVHSPVSWVTITGSASGSGDGVVRFQIAANDGPARSARVAVADSFVTIDQAQGCSYTVTPPAHNIPAQGGTGSATITTQAGCTWTAASGADWVTVSSGQSGSGAGRIEFNVAANQGPERSGSLTIAGRTVTVTQASGCTYSINPSSITFPSAGGTQSVSITTTAGCPWTAGADLSWVQAAPRSGTGPASVQLTAPANFSPSRSGSATVAGQPVALNQPSQCTYALIPGSSSYDWNGGSGGILVIVSGPCTWRAETDVSWINIAPGTASGTGEGAVQFNVTANNGALRRGTITIAGQAHVVTQSGR